MWLSPSRIGHIQHSPQQVGGAVTARRNVVTPSIPKPSIALRWLIRLTAKQTVVGAPVRSIGN
jgi:hypothetical protein